MTILLPQRPSTDNPAPLKRPTANGHTSRLVNPRIVAATARRVLGQLRGDRRTVAMLMVVPSALLCLISQMLNSQPAFNKTGLTLLGIFPFTLMFLVTSIAMLRERTSGTLERLLTTPLSKLDLLLGYGIAFAVAATAQAIVTCTTAYLVLDLYTPGSPVLVLAVAIAGAVLGMALGLLASAFATSEFQAVQFMPVVVFPQVFLGGLFVPREQMSDVLHAISYALPMTYSIDALDEVGSTSLVSLEYLGDMCAVLGAALLALVLAATTLRRRTGDRTEAQARRLRLIPLSLAALASAFLVFYWVDTSHYVTTDNAVVDGDQIPIIAPVSGTLVDWDATLGATVRDDQVVGRLQLPGAGAPRRVLRAPSEGTVVVDDGVNGSFVTAGTRLGVAYDLPSAYVTARIDEGDRDDVALGRQVDVRLDSAPDRPLVGYVQEIQPSTASPFDRSAPDNSKSSFDRYDQVIPVKIVVPDHRGVSFIPGLNVTVKIHKN
ncbi:MAG TPA: ABC transporter permease [Pseudonocardia sp.]|jgi:ABC-2 type transport system permease protein|nr:ABC transporter permease [Pseudonocardia sp.]